MKRNTQITLAILAAAGIAATSLATMAEARGGWGDRMGRGTGDGPQIIQRFDADGNGAVTAAEIATGRAEMLARYDADDDGTLSLAEFEALHAELARGRMVRGFQFIDTDGDGAVTEAEMTALADRMMARMDIDDDGDIDADDRAARRQIMRGSRGDRRGQGRW